MRRSDLAHLVRAAATITGDSDVVVIGSQAILGTYDEDELPPTVTFSREADVAFWNDEDNAKSDLVDGAIGEESTFDAMNGYYAQGVSITTANLPWDWRSRLVRFAPTAGRPGIAWCLERHDLALAKLAAGREKDYEYVHALANDSKLDLDVMLGRLDSMAIAPLQITRIRKWIEAESRRVG